VRCGDAAVAQRSDSLLPYFFKKFVEVEEDAVHAGNNEAVGATSKLVHFFDGDAVDFVVDVEAADVLAVAYLGKRKVRGGRKRGAA
jgi:hypothetical protein